MKGKASVIIASIYSLNPKLLPNEIFFFSRNESTHLNRLSETSENFVNGPKCNDIKAKLPELTCKMYHNSSDSIAITHGDPCLLVSAVLFQWV